MIKLIKLYLESIVALVGRIGSHGQGSTNGREKGAGNVHSAERKVQMD